MELEGKLNKDDGNWVPSINSNELIENLIDASVESTTIVKSPIINSKISSNTNDSTDVFIVHGHDNEAKQEVARFIEKLNINAVILHEQPNKGRTVIEKLVEESHTAGYAIILLTPDDVGYVKGTEKQEEFRSRQNVVLELGYFIGKIGRENICVLLI